MKSNNDVIDVKNILQVKSEEFEKRHNETREKINRVSEEMNKWRYPQRATIVLSNKYR